MVKFVSAALFASLLASGAQAATFTFPLSGSSSTSGTHGNARTFSATTGGQTLNLQVTAWNLFNGTVYNSFLGAFSPGLGATSDDETGGSNTHTLDNQTRTDFLLLQFDRAVNLVSGKFTPYAVGGSTDTDATIAWGTSNIAWNAPLGYDNKPAAMVLPMTGTSESLGGATAGVRSFATGGAYANLWMVAASMNNRDGIDGFKFGTLTAQTNAVPEPANWVMMIGGFGMIGGAMRRRRVTKTVFFA